MGFVAFPDIIAEDDETTGAVVEPDEVAKVDELLTVTADDEDALTATIDDELIEEVV